MYRLSTDNPLYGVQVCGNLEAAVALMRALIERGAAVTIVKAPT